MIDEAILGGCAVLWLRRSALVPIGPNSFEGHFASQIERLKGSDVELRSI